MTGSTNSITANGIVYSKSHKQIDASNEPDRKVLLLENGTLIKVIDNE
jgi:hypothetical protein